LNFKKTFLFFGIITFLFQSCNKPNRTNFRIYSPTKEQCVTIITKGKTRFVINGEHKTIPNSNYIKVDISQIDRIGDEIGICWKNEVYEWEIVNHQSKIIENKLDTLKYRFNTRWENDERGIPNTKKYRKPKCATLDLLRMKCLPKTEYLILEN
jgi:hypothetical protein